MRAVTILAAITGTGIVLLLLAMLAIKSEMPAVPVAKKQMQAQEPEYVQETGQAPEAQQPAAGQAQEENKSLPVQAAACKALEEQLIEEAERAESDLNKARRTYEKADESYDAALDASQTDQAAIDYFRKEKQEAEELRDEAEKRQRTALKRLTIARQECGLYQTDAQLP